MNTSLIRRALALVICVLTVLSLSPLTVSAEFNSTLNLSNVEMNEKGDGYYWDNPTRVLTLDGFSLDTDSDFGLKLPENATVKLVGTNRISASKYALSSMGNITFTGSGTLIIESDEVGIYSYSNNPSHKIRITDGKIKVTGKTQAILSEHAEISVTGGSHECVGGIKGRVFSISGGSLASDGTIDVSHQFSISCADLEAYCKDSAAIRSGNLFDTEYVSLMCGNDSSSLTEKDTYNGESYVNFTHTSKAQRASILFGEGTPIAVDYLLLGAVILLIAAAIAIPSVRKHRKTKKLYRDLDKAKQQKK